MTKEVSYYQLLQKCRFIPIKDNITIFNYGDCYVCVKDNNSYLSENKVWISGVDNSVRFKFLSALLTTIEDMGINPYE